MWLSKTLHARLQKVFMPTPDDHPHVDEDFYLMSGKLNPCRHSLTGKLRSGDDEVAAHPKAVQILIRDRRTNHDGIHFLRRLHPEARLMHDVFQSMVGLHLQSHG